MAEQVVLVERSGLVAKLTLNRPHRRNAINLDMRRELDAALAALAVDDGVLVVVLTGAGSAFSAGVDLTEDAPASPVGGPGPVAAALAGFRKPIIAAINGPAVGGGLELALACDIRIAATSARCGLPEVRIGSLPGSGGTQRLPRVVGPGAAARMILTGELINAPEALRIGLVSAVVAPDELVPHVMDLAGRIAANGPLSLVAAKEALQAAQELGLAEGLQLERTRWKELAESEDRAEGRAAFREGRPPGFSGR